MIQKTLVMFSLSFLFGIGCCAPVRAQQPPTTSENYVAWAQQFLRAICPELNGKRNLSVEASVPYDQPGAAMRRLDLSVGEGPRNQELGFSGGCESEVLPVTMVLPVLPELGPTPPRPGPSFRTPGPGREPGDPCHIGPIYPKQFLSAIFQFDEKGRLASFTARGFSVGNQEAEKMFAELIPNDREKWEEMKDAEILAALKKAGIKYGPDDRGEFIRNLPIAELGRFLGNLTMVSVNFHTLREDRDNVGSWPDWEVMADARQSDGTTVRYRMLFEHRRAI